MINEKHLSWSDFSGEERLFAQELQALFNLGQGALPLNYIHVLSKEPDRMVAPEALDQRVTTEVFRRLHLSQHFEVAAQQRQPHFQAQ